MNPHVCLQIALRGKRASTDLAAEGPFSGVRTVVHLKRAATAEHAVTDDTLVWIAQLVLDVVDQLLELGCLRRSRHLHQGLPRIVVTSRLG